MPTEPAKSSLSAKPFFSILLASKDAGSILEDAIHSITNQTFTDWELVLINDGSNLESSHKMKLLSLTDDRIRLIDQENIGLTKSLIKGVTLANGKYIVRHDADDISELTRLEILHSNIVKNDFDVIFSRAKTFKNKTPIKIVPPTFLLRGLRVDVLKFGNVFIHGTVCIKKECFESANYDPNFKYAQDYDLFCKLLLLPLKIAYIEKPLYNLRISDSSISFKNQAEQVHCAKLICEMNFGNSQFHIPSRKKVLRPLFHAVRLFIIILNFILSRSRVHYVKS
jgi:glycosyltransferase involved in cell wall biosynthesis